MVAYTASLCTNLNKCNFALADIAVDVFDRHLSVVFDPTLATQDVMDAGCHLVPFIMVPKPAENTHIYTQCTV